MTGPDSALRDGDRATLGFADGINARLREVLCTLARRGAAIRQDDPQRARQILDALAPWPFYKGGQFLFDLLEWEDFMIDGEPPPILSRATFGKLLDLPVGWVDATLAAVETHAPGPLRPIVANPQVRWLTATAQSTLHGVVRGLTGLVAPPGTPGTEPDADDDTLPPLQSGFYLYEDVVLGLFDLIGSRLPHLGEPENPAPEEPGREDETEEGPTAPDQPTSRTENAPSIAVFPLEETFRVARVEDLEHDWTLRGDATLVGDDGLQLTPAAHDKAGTALLNVPFPSTAGVAVDFDFYCAGGNGDGFAVYLIDGASDTDVGGYGAGLGYSRGPDGKGNGVTKGWLGLGFDKFGNFSGILAGPCTEDVPKPNHIVLRGSGDRDTGFAHITGVAAPGGLDAVWTDRAHVQVLIIDAVVTVHVTRDDTTTTVFDGVDLKLAAGQAPVPETFKLGLSASTGGEVSRHCLRNLVVAMPTAMPLTVDGAAEAAAGSRISFTVTVRNDGPNDVPDAVVTGTTDAVLSDVDIAVSLTGGGASATSAGSAEDGTFRQPLDLPVGGTATITVTGTVDRAATGEVTCSAKIESKKCSNTSPDASDSHDTRLTESIPKDDLKVCRHAAVSIPPGAEGHIAVSVENPDDNPIDLANADLVFDAPTGFEWTGTMMFTYYHVDGQSQGSGGTTMSPSLEQGGRRLRSTGLQQLRADEGYVLTYTLGIRAKADAQPGRYTDGTAVVAGSRPLRLTATVQDPAQPRTFTNNDTALPVVQPALLEIKQGETGFLAVTVGFEQDTDHTLDSLTQQFTAPSGFRWSGFVSYSYYTGGRNTQGSQGDVQHKITRNGTILKITGIPSLKASKGLYLTYVLGLTAAEDAAPGLHGNGKAKIGSARVLTLHAMVVDEDEPSRCNR
ncbi:putative repeat protein (TIGR01451 family) [Saccharothrix carnea]|uniref:Putative repeat protein (TIGR01451 family) n=1 Tax=Saccharothrix carnea TaxID=1280637 RepID=A0A2P8I0A6_SACCR|nr:DUF11 domain-containing protein [Saccharothrix carnea]PSL51898.1 putative repeat protein (TIGR01451 family) [Saccharothrix carnea]